MNALARLSDLRADLNAQGVTTDDSRLVSALEEASKAAFTHARGRQFFTTYDTRYFSGNNERIYYLDTDLISITTLKISTTVYQPTTFEKTLVVNTDYTLWPRNAALDTKPYRAILFNPDGQYAVAPYGYDNIQIIGKWGYFETLQPVVVSGAAVTGTVADTTTLTITTSADTTDTLCAGDTLYIEDEQIGPVLTIASGSLVVEARGINGTTAAAHSAKAISLRRYPDDIERAVRADAARYLWRAAQGFPEGGFREMWPAISQTLDSYADPAGVI